MNRTTSYPFMPEVTAFAINLRPILFLMVVMSMLSANRCAADPPSATVPDKATAQFLRETKTLPIALTFQKASMTTLIAALAKQSKRSILVNDEPRNNQADIDFKGTLKDALDSVATAYDYAWTVNKRGIVLMTKRYSRKEEYPPLNVEELQETAKDSLAILKTFTFNPQPDVIPLILAVYSSLTKEQAAALQAGQKLRSAQLSPDQNKIVEEAILNGLLSPPFNIWSQCADQMERITSANPAAHLRLHRYDSKQIDRGAGLVDFASHLFQLEYMTLDKRGNEWPIGLFAMRDLPARPRQESDPKKNSSEQNNCMGQAATNSNPQEAIVAAAAIQQKEIATAAAILQAPAHLSLGATTVKAVMASLAQQTGLKIQAESYLETRKLVVHLDNLSGQEALDTLTELNDWRWINKGNGLVLITRRRVLLPEHLKDLPMCLINAFPKDYRRFLGFGVAAKDLPEPKIISPQGQEMTFAGANEELDHTSRVFLRLQRLNDQKPQTLFDALQPGIMDNRIFHLKDLSPALQVDLQDALVLRILATLNRGPYLDLLNNGLMPYQKDRDTVEIYLYGGNGLMIGSPVNGSSAFFGTAVPGLKPRRGPMPIPIDPFPLPEKP